MKKFLFLLLLPFVGFGQFNPVAFYEYGVAKKAFTSTWKTDNLSAGSSTSTQVKLPTVVSGVYACTVDWGDGNTTSLTTATYNTANTHTYSISGTYQIKIKGTFTGIQFNNTGDRLKLLSVQKWGSLRLGNTGAYFYGCSNLNLSSVSDVIDLTGTTTLFRAFTDCSSLTSINRFTEWNTGSITTLSNAFFGATLFNQNLNSLNVLSVIDFTNTFNNAQNFNNGLASGVSGAMTWTINTTSNVLMNGIFASAIRFNQNIGSWSMIKVTGLNGAFLGASLFNNGGSNSINTWVTTSLSDIAGCFRNAVAFNQPIGNWNIILCTSLATVFDGATIFNQDISTWNTINIVNSSACFRNALAFNQPIGIWNMAKCTFFNLMFQNANAFNQNLGSWNVSLGGDFNGFMSGKTAANFSTTNLDAIYNGWLSNKLIPALNTSFGTAKYTASGAEGKALFTRANTTKTITNAVNNGSGLIRITAIGHGLTTGNKSFIHSIVGTTEANGLWVVTVIDSDNIDLQGSSFSNTYTSGGTLITGYGYTITDGGI